MHSCPLYKDTTQVVPGEGAARARIMLVGEQPGDQEDKQGLPFVGPAGRVLAKALAESAEMGSECLNRTTRLGTQAHKARRGDCDGGHRCA